MAFGTTYRAFEVYVALAIISVVSGAKPNVLTEFFESIT